jgi:hypothetical protein
MAIHRPVAAAVAAVADDEKIRNDRMLHAMRNHPAQARPRLASLQQQQNNSGNNKKPLEPTDDKNNHPRHVSSKSNEVKKTATPQARRRANGDQDIKQMEIDLEDTPVEESDNEDFNNPDNNLIAWQKRLGTLVRKSENELTVNERKMRAQYIQTVLNISNPEYNSLMFRNNPSNITNYSQPPDRDPKFYVPPVSSWDPSRYQQETKVPAGDSSSSSSSSSVSSSSREPNANSQAFSSSSSSSTTTSQPVPLTNIISDNTNDSAASKAAAAATTSPFTLDTLLQKENRHHLLGLINHTSSEGVDDVTLASIAPSFSNSLSTSTLGSGTNMRLNALIKLNQDKREFRELAESLVEDTTHKFQHDLEKSEQFLFAWLNLLAEEEIASTFGRGAWDTYITKQQTNQGLSDSETSEDDNDNNTNSHTHNTNRKGHHVREKEQVDEDSEDDSEGSSSLSSSSDDDDKEQVSDTEEEEEEEQQGRSMHGKPSNSTKPSNTTTKLNIGSKRKQRDSIDSGPAAAVITKEQPRKRKRPNSPFALRETKADNALSSASPMDIDTGEWTTQEQADAEEEEEEENDKAKEAKYHRPQFQHQQQQQQRHRHHHHQKKSKKTRVRHRDDDDDDGDDDDTDSSDDDEEEKEHKQDEDGDVDMQNSRRRRREHAQDKETEDSFGFPPSSFAGTLPAFPIPTEDDYTFDCPYPVYDSKSIINKTTVGDQNMEEAYDAVWHINPPMHPDQEEFFHNFIKLTEPFIRGPSEYVRRRAEIMQREDMTETLKILLLSAVRRFGKSLGGQSSVATLMVKAIVDEQLPMGLRILVVAQKLDVARLFISAVKASVMLIPESKHRRIVKNSASNFWITAANETRIHESVPFLEMQGKLVKLEACAGTVTGLKGRGAELMVIDEMALLALLAITEGLGPILNLPWARLVGMSTFAGKSNSKFTEMMHSKLPEWDRIGIRMEKKYMCNACTLERKSPWDCKHKEHLLPVHLNTAAAVGRVMLGDSADVFAREMRGVVINYKNCIFPQELIDSFSAKPGEPIQTLTAHDVDGCMLYTAVDPNGGTEQATSHMGIVTIARRKNLNIYIAGMASRNTMNAHEIRLMMNQYFRQFSDERSVWKSCPHKIMIEGNYGGTNWASELFYMAKKANPGLQLYSDKPGFYNVTTTRGLKKIAVGRLISHLEMDQIKFVSPLIVGDNSKPDENPAAMRKLLYTQLNNCRAMPDGKGDYDIGAKHPEIGLPDDTLIALFIVLVKSLQDIYSQAMDREQRMYEQMERQTRERRQEREYQEAAQFAPTTRDLLRRDVMDFANDSLSGQYMDPNQYMDAMIHGRLGGPGGDGGGGFGF